MMLSKSYWGGNMKKRKIKFAKKDFEVKDLPSNRIEVLTDILKIRFDLIIKTGTILFIFLIPLIVFSITKNISIFTLKDNYQNGVIDLELYNQSRFSVEIIYAFLQVISLLLFSLGLSGVLNIFKRACFYENIQFKDDFFKGIKENSRHVFLTFLIFGLLFFMMTIYMQMNNSLTDFFTTIICYLPIVLGIILIIPVLLIVIFQIPIYQNTFIQYLKNGMFFYGKSIFKTIGLMIALFIPYLPLFIPNVYSAIISIIVICFIVLPITILTLVLYCNHLFDEYLNKEQFKEIYKKGLSGK